MVSSAYDTVIHRLYLTESFVFILNTIFSPIIQAEKME